MLFQNGEWNELAWPSHAGAALVEDEELEEDVSPEPEEGEDDGATPGAGGLQADGRRRSEDDEDFDEDFDDGEYDEFDDDDDNLDEDFDEDFDEDEDLEEDVGEEGEEEDL